MGASSLRPSHPSKKSPQLQPFRISATVASSPLDLRRVRCTSTSSAATTLDLEALLRCWVCGTHEPLPAAKYPLLPWALRPSRVLARRASLDPKRLRFGPMNTLPPDHRNVAVAPVRLPPDRRPTPGFHRAPLSAELPLVSHTLSPVCAASSKRRSSPSAPSTISPPPK